MIAVPKSLNSNNAQSSTSVTTQIFGAWNSIEIPMGFLSSLVWPLVTNRARSLIEHGVNDSIERSTSDPPFGFTAARNTSSNFRTGDTKSNYALPYHSRDSYSHCIHSRQDQKTSNLPLPPGPKKWPLLGNLFDLPTSYEWLTYAKLCKECSMYGGLALFNSC